MNDDLNAVVTRLTEGVDLITPVPDDPVAVYAEQVTVGGLDDPAIAAIRAIRAEVDAVPGHDMATQQAMAAEPCRRHLELADDL